MKAELSCPDCGPEVETLVVVELLPKNDSVYEIECPNGHRFRANILYHEFEKLFEVAIDALVDQYYREAIGAFAASYERLMELFVRIVTKANGVESEIVRRGWKKVARQSERQLGAFIFLFILEFKKEPSLLNEQLVALRNKVVHQGYFPTREECVAYGSSVLRFLRDTLALLYESQKHKGELVRSVNDQGDFSPSGPRAHYLPWSYIGANRPPASNSSTLEEILEAATRSRADRRRRL